MVFEVFRGSGCLITFRHSKQQGENEHPGQLRSSQGFGEESKAQKLTWFRSDHLNCHAPMSPSSRILASTVLRDQSSQWHDRGFMWMSCEMWIVTNKLRF